MGRRGDDNDAGNVHGGDCENGGGCGSDEEDAECGGNDREMHW